MRRPSPAPVSLSLVRLRDDAMSACLASAAHPSPAVTRNGAAHTTASPAIPAPLRSTIRCESCAAALLPATPESSPPLSSRCCPLHCPWRLSPYAMSPGGLRASQPHLSYRCP